jgi:2-polyprenyl-3-methyl-5-hydroxy-6-metoxy-1,4-benzoquinol methylase
MTKEEVRRQMDEIYSSLSPENIPWNRPKPPDALETLIESGKVTPCKAIDLGCGLGNYAIYLARRGLRLQE